MKASEKKALLRYIEAKRKRSDLFGFFLNTAITVIGKSQNIPCHEDAKIKEIIGACVKYHANPSRESLLNLVSARESVSNHTIRNYASQGLKVAMALANFLESSHILEMTRHVMHNYEDVRNFARLHIN